MAVNVDHVNDSLGSSKTVHTATLDDSNLELSITVLSRAVSMSSTPLYHDGDTIIGTVHINSSKNSGIQDISISVSGLACVVIVSLNTFVDSYAVNTAAMGRIPRF